MYAPNGGPFSGLHKAGVSLALCMHLMEGLFLFSLALCMHLMEGLFLAFIRQVSVLHCVCIRPFSGLHKAQSCIVYAPNGGPFSGLHKAGVSLALSMHLIRAFFWPP